MKERVEAQEDASIEVSFETVLAASPAQVWELLTTTAGLKKWFNELEVGELGLEGYLEFIMTPTEKIKMPILSYQPNEIVGFQWDQNQVLFHLEAKGSHQTKLTFIEIVTAVNEHSGRDIAGWKMCLQRLEALCEGKKHAFIQAEFDQSAKHFQGELDFLYET